MFCVWQHPFLRLAKPLASLVPLILAAKEAQKGHWGWPWPLTSSQECCKATADNLDLIVYICGVRFSNFVPWLWPWGQWPWPLLFSAFRLLESTSFFIYSVLQMIMCGCRLQRECMQQWARWTRISSFAGLWPSSASITLTFCEISLGLWVRRKKEQDIGCMLYKTTSGKNICLGWEKTWDCTGKNVG